MPKKSEDKRIGKKIIDKFSLWFEKVCSYTYSLPWLTDDGNLWLNLILQPIDLMQYCKTKFGEWKKEKSNKKIAPYEHLLASISSNESKELIKHFIAHCDNLSYKDESGKSFLIQAANSSRIDLMEVFLENKTIKSTINFQDNEGNTALFYAIKNKMPQTTLTDFIENGARLDIRNNLGDTPLMQAVKNNNFEAAEALIVATNAQSNSYIGKFYGWVKSKIFGIQVNSLINTANKQGLTPLHIALQNKNPKMVDLLLKNNASTDLKYLDGKKSVFSTFLDGAIKGYYKSVQLKQEVFDNIAPVCEIIDLLQKSELNSNPTDYLYTAIASFMHHPSELGLNIIFKLLDNIDKDIKDDKKRNILHIAVGHAYQSLLESEDELHKKLITKLITLVGEEGKNLKDNLGYTPLDLAIGNENQGIIELLGNHFYNRANSTYKPEQNQVELRDQRESSLSPPSQAVLFSSGSSNGGTDSTPVSPIKRMSSGGSDSSITTTPVAPSNQTPSKRAS